MTLYKIVKKFLKIIWWNQPEKYAAWLGVKIGNGVRFIGHPNWGTEPYLIKIGDHTEISFDCTFLTHDGATWIFRNRPELREKHIMKFGSIVIGNNCFIGCKSLIMPNIKIGDNVIVGAGSLVSKNIPSNEVWAGTPAKHIMTTDQYIEKCIKSNIRFDMNSFDKNKRNTLVRYFTRGEL